MNARSVARAVGLLLVAAACVVVGGCGGNGKSVQPLLPALVIDESGHGLVVRDTVGSVTPDRALSWSYHELHAPAVHHDGERFAIVGRPTKHDPLRLYVGTLDGKPPRSLGADVDARTRLAWLPDDRIVYSAIAHDTSRALFVTASQDRPGGQITFSGTHANDPFVLKDGRVLFCGTRVETDGTRKPALFTVRPDGTGLLLFHGATPGERYARPWQRSDGDVTFLAYTGAEATAWAVSWRAPAEAARKLECGEPWHPDGWPTSPRSRPQGSSSMVNPAKTTGSLLMVDARRGVDAPPHAMRFLSRVLDEEAGTYAWRSLGRVPLEDDGSCFAELPADTPLRMEVLGKDARVLRATRTPFWLRPGEIRGMTSCEDVPDETPPNVRPAAALRDAVAPLPEGA